MAYQGLVESPTAEVSQLMVTNPLRILRSGQVPVISSRVRSASVASSLPSKIQDCVRNSVPDNLNGSKPDISGESAIPTYLHPKDENPIPLPPRDRNKTLLAAKPRHTRKHPLIIPPSSLQRTLDKVNTVSPTSTTMADPFRNSTPEPVYTNNVSQLTDKNPDSLHFEAQIESNLNALDEIPQEQDVVDGITDNFSNLQTDHDKLPSHHVSCEDLLKFADSKPSSRTRGNDSDEVRIMSKVLGRDVTTEKCLKALDQSDWDVMKAIKILKLQNVVVSADLSSCFNALENSTWDITKAAQWILQQDEVTQV